MKISFLGAAGTVTGSKYLVDIAGKRILVDCGLFQGRKELRLLNWSTPPVDPSSIDAIILTHAHIDHSGYVPLMTRSGYKGPVFCTPATKDLCGLLLPDSGYLMEKDAEYANRKGFSKHTPALPLYTRKQAEESLENFRTVNFDDESALGSGVSFRLRPAGHILGSAFVTLTHGSTKIVFSGDLGRHRHPLMLEPAKVSETTYLVVESTYGDRLHESSDPEDMLAEIINNTVRRGGSVIVPSFAVGRAQTLLYYLHQLKQKSRIPDVPVFLDSPMAVNASEIFCRNHEDHRLTADQCRQACSVARYVNSVEESKELDHAHMPMILISASGMATGGRILHHLKSFAPDAKNTILFAGFQAGGTRGDRMVRGETEVKIHGGMVPIRAEVKKLDMLSAHADQNEIMNWLGGFTAPPRQTFVTHGENAASETLAEKIREDLGWECVVPQLREVHTLP